MLFESTGVDTPGIDHTIPLNKKEEKKIGWCDPEYQTESKQTSKSMHACSRRWPVGFHSLQLDDAHV